MWDGAPLVGLLRANTLTAWFSQSTSFHVRAIPVIAPPSFQVHALQWVPHQ